MFDDVECPYCKEKFKIILEDENPDELYEYECPNCRKVMMFQYELYPSLKTYAAPCKNGENHKYEKVHGAPEWHFAGRKSCKWCNKEVLNLEINMMAKQKFLDAHDGELY